MEDKTMSKYLVNNLELQLMEVSQDPTSIAYQQNSRFLSGPPVTHSADDWNNTLDASIDFDNYVDINELFDTDLDNDIVDFSIDE